jgi:hypothetical protein
MASVWSQRARSHRADDLCRRLVPKDGQSLLDLNEVASHSPNVTAPEALMALLQKIAA